MKNEVLKIVKNALVGADDELYRAKIQFGQMNDEQLAEKYGQSGQTCGAILEGCQTRKDKLERCVEWVNSAA